MQGELLEDENFDEIKKKLQDKYDLEGSEREALSYEFADDFPVIDPRNTM